MASSLGIPTLKISTGIAFGASSAYIEDAKKTNRRQKNNFL
jgi:hypothetical protein